MWKVGMLASKLKAKELRTSNILGNKKGNLVGCLFLCALTGPKRPEAVSGVAKASRGDLHLHHIFCLRSFRALGHLKLNFLALFESLEAVALDGAIVNKDVRRAWLFDETITLRIVKPLDLTGYSRHNNESS